MRSSPVGVTMTQGRGLRILRLLRGIRALRIIRVVRFLRALRILIYSLYITMQSLVWAVLLLLLVLYIFAYLVYVFVTDFGTSPGLQTDLDIQMANEIELYWSTLPIAMLTLLQSIAGGVDWAHALRPLRHVNEALLPIFLLYICMTWLALLNVIQAVFCQNAIEGAQQNKEIATMVRMVERQKLMTSLRGLFKDLD